MKKELLFFLFLVVLGVQAQDRFMIEGHLKNIADGTVFHLFKEEGQVGCLVASDTLQNGMFRFKCVMKNEGVEKYSLMAVDPENFPSMTLDLWIGPGSHLKVYADNPYIHSWTVESDVPEQQFQQKLIDASRDKWEQLQSLMLESMQLRMSSRDKKVREKADSLMNVVDKIQLEIDGIDMTLMRELPVNAAWMDAFQGLGMSMTYNKDFPYAKELRALYDMLDDSQKKSAEAKSVYLALDPPVVVEAGDMAVDADMYDLQGRVHRMSELRGKYVLLDFWSRGCGPCISSQPELKEISELYKDSLEVISLSLENRKGWEEASKTHSITWNNWNDLEGKNGLYSRYGVKGIPHFVLISPEGKVIDSWTGYGKGMLKLKMKYLRTSKPAMSIEMKSGNKVVNHPDKKSSSIDVLAVQRVELTDTATILHMRARYIPKNWIRLAKTTFIVSDTGVKCELLRSEKFPIEEKVYMPESGELDFTLYFAPLPADTSCFDFSEGDNMKNGYIIKGVRLTD